jgi:hypothetical protein
MAVIANSVDFSRRAGCRHITAPRQAGKHGAKQIWPKAKSPASLPGFSFLLLDRSLR